MNECSGFIGHFFGHKYSPRYDTKLPAAKSIYGGAVVLEAMKQKIYRGDVCNRCGDIVNNEE